MVEKEVTKTMNAKLRVRTLDKSILDGEYPIAEEIYRVISEYHNKVDLARQFLEVIPLFYDDSQMWWRWKETQKRWLIVDEVDILNLIKNCCYGLNIIQTKERTEILNALKQLSRERKPKAIKNTWIQFKDEIVDLETGHRFKATSEYFVKNPIPYNLGRNGDTPVMDDIFTQWVGKDHVKTLYQILAYSILADYPLHRLFCFIGAGMNGKSCYLNLLRKFVGNGNCASTELDTLISSRFEVTRLHSKLVCLMGETNFNDMNKTSTLKKLTGGDFIGFEYKNKKPFEDINYAKIIIATNNLPTTSDKTIGFYRRWLIVDFPNQFTEKKDILGDIPEHEYENLAMKCIPLLIELLEKREFHNEGTIEERMKRYEDKSDFLKKFMEDFIIEDSNSYITKADFRKKFWGWCKENRHRELAENTLSKKLKERGVEVARKYFGWLNEQKGGQLPVYLGLKWRN